MLCRIPRLLNMKPYITAVAIAELLISAPAITFAAGDNLRPSAAKKSTRVYDMRKNPQRRRQNNRP